MIKYWDTYKWFLVCLLGTLFYCSLYVLFYYFFPRTDGSINKLIHSMASLPIGIGGIFISFYIIPWDFTLTENFWLKTILQITILCAYIYYFISHGKLKNMTYMENFIAFGIAFILSLASNQMFKDSIWWFVELFFLIFSRVFVGVQIGNILINSISDILNYINNK